MNQGYVSAAAPSPADHVKAAAAACLGQSGWWGQGATPLPVPLLHAPPPPALTTCRGPPRCWLPGGTELFFSAAARCAVPAVWFAAARGTAAVQRARARRLYSPRARRQHCSSSTSWCGLQHGVQHCSTRHSEMLQTATRTAYIRTKYLYTAVSISIKTRYTSAQLCVDHFSKYFGVDTRYTLQ